MRQFVTLLATLLLLSSTAFGQDSYYYSDERQIPIEQTEKWKVIQIPESAQSVLTSALSRRSGIRLRKVLDADRGFYWLEARSQQMLTPTTLDQLSQEVQIQRTVPAFFRVQGRDTTHIVMTDAFSVKFEAGVTRAEIDAFNEKYDVEVAPLDDEIDRRQAREYNEYPLRVTETSELNVLEAANRYYESALTVWSVPTFYTNLQREGRIQRRSSANDPLYSKQYYLNNTSSNLGTADVDIDAPEAWTLSKGSSSITVAVVDDGVEQHEDFRSGQVVTGRTAGGGDGSPSSTSEHGQAVAGIIAANHNNNKGVRGVAPNVAVMPINIFDGPYGEPTGDAIDYAWQNGADVLSNSWSGPTHDEIDAAIQRARTQGRNGNGTVVVKSAGNTGNKVTYPATVSGMLVVGAVDKNNNKWYYTPDDSEVEIVAPSGDVNLLGDVRTTDHMGSDGYESGDYTPRFGGTSAAAPQASGVAALLLSEHPGLEEDEVRQVIKTSADYYGSANWNGYGRLNAHKALTSPPFAPDNFRIENSSCTSCYVHLRWNKSPRATSYEIYRDKNGSGFQQIATTGGTDYWDYGTQISGSWSDPKVGYYVRAVNQYGTSSPSAYAITPYQKSATAENEKRKRALPDTTVLRAPAPNPMREQATIRYGLPEAATVRLTVYDVMGRRVATLVRGRKPAGYHEATLQAPDFPSGVYLYRLEAGAFTQAKRLTVVR